MERKAIKRETLEDLIKNMINNLGICNLHFIVESLLEEGFVVDTKEAKQFFSILLVNKYLSGYYSDNVLWKATETFRSRHTAVLNMKLLEATGDPLAIFLVKNLIDKYNLEYEFESTRKNKKRSECERMIKELVRKCQQSSQQQVLTPNIQESSEATTDKNQELLQNCGYAIQDPNLLPQSIQRKE